MKFFATLFLIQLSLEASAAGLVAEAECTGMLEGEEIVVQGLVNPNNWCEIPANDLNSAILMKQGSDISVATTVTTEAALPTGEVEVALTSSEPRFTTKLTYIIDGVPSRGAGKLEMIDGEETISGELKCEFPSYHMDC